MSISFVTPKIMCDIAQELTREMRNVYVGSTLNLIFLNGICRPTMAIAEKAKTKYHVIKSLFWNFCSFFNCFTLLVCYKFVTFKNITQNYALFHHSYNIDFLAREKTKHVRKNSIRFYLSQTTHNLAAFVIVNNKFCTLAFLF